MDKAVSHVSGFVEATYAQWDLATRAGFLQGLDPRVKVVFLVLFVVVVSLRRTIQAQLAVAAFLLVLVTISRVSLRALYGRTLPLAFVFGTVVALPSALNIFTPGEVWIPILHLSAPKTILWLTVPETVGISREGAAGVLLLTSRVVNSLTITFLVLYTTPITEFVRALKLFRVPDTMLLVILLAYKYVFVFVKTIEGMHLARKARLAGGVDEAEARRWAAGRMAQIFRRTQLRCDELFRAMLARGFSGTIQVREASAMARRDWASGIGVLAAAGAFCML
jgi:cobalt ECF transporter T component CbiQ